MLISVPGSSFVCRVPPNLLYKWPLRTICGCIAPYPIKPSSSTFTYSGLSGSTATAEQQQQSVDELGRVLGKNSVRHPHPPVARYLRSLLTVVMIVMKFGTWLGYESVNCEQYY